MSRVGETTRTTSASTASSKIRLSVSSNDPVQKVKSLGDGSFRISGVGSNRGTISSVLFAKIDGKRISAAIRGGQSPAQTASALIKKLPKGYEGSSRAIRRNPLSDVIVTVVRSVAPKSQVDSPNASNGNFRNIRLVEGFGAARSQIVLTHGTSNTAVGFVSDVKKTSRGVVVRVASYRTPGSKGGAVMRAVERLVVLPAMSGGTPVIVENRDGTVLFSAQAAGGSY